MRMITVTVIRETLVCEVESSSCIDSWRRGSSMKAIVLTKAKRIGAMKIIIFCRLVFKLYWLTRALKIPMIFVDLSIKDSIELGTIDTVKIAS